ncbi:MAG TPA: hypothetical protein IAA02_01950, partial [Candidatus Sutterella merdavium]|nr:hypothetical protein [Candidatus Sutterella merdavium]
ITGTIESSLTTKPLPTMLWLILPALAHVLFAAHLLFHGAALWVVALPVAALVLAFVPVRYMNRLQQLCLLGYACEWAYSTYELVARRILEGRSYHPALEIMAGVTLFTLLTALVFYRPKLLAYYRCPGQS